MLIKNKINMPANTNALQSAPEIIDLDAIPAAADLPNEGQVYRWNEIIEGQWVLKLRDSLGNEHAIKEDIGVVSDFVDDDGKQIEYTSDPLLPYEIYSEGLLENNVLTISNTVNILDVGIKVSNSTYKKIVPKEITVNYDIGEQYIDFGDMTVETEIIVWYATGNVVLSGGTMSAFSKVGISESTMLDNAMMLALLFND